MSIADIRQPYHDAPLNEADVDPDPIVQFNRWLQQAIATNPGEWFEPNAMTLATIGADGAPAARMVLLKHVSTAGFTFYTNYASQKGRELHADPRAALVFHWAALSRQVRIDGTVARTSPQEAQAYFHTRPRDSQLGALASPQSSVIPDRRSLEATVAQLAKQYEGHEIPRPPTWGGFRLHPERIEFWQGRPNRLHDRLRYTRQDNGSWRIQRLAP